MYQEDKKPLTGTEQDYDPVYPPADDICTTCDGTGDYNGHLCKDCGGKGSR